MKWNYWMKKLLTMRTRNMRSVATRQFSAKAQDQQSIPISPMRCSTRDPASSACSRVNMTLRMKTRSMGHAINEQCSNPAETTSGDESALQQPPNPSNPNISPQPVRLGKRKRTGRDVPIEQYSNKATPQEQIENLSRNRTGRDVSIEQCSNKATPQEQIENLSWTRTQRNVPIEQYSNKAAPQEQIENSSRKRTERDVPIKQSSNKATPQEQIEISSWTRTGRDVPIKQSSNKATPQEQIENSSRKRTRRDVPIEQSSYKATPQEQIGNLSWKRTGRDVPVEQFSNQATYQEQIENTCSSQTDMLDDSMPITPRPGRRFNLHGKILKEGVRGPTFMSKVWGQRENKRMVVSFNEFGQPNDRESSSVFAHFLGTLARDGTYASLEYQTWRDIPEDSKKNMLNVVKSRFDLPPGKNKFILQSISKKWRAWKSSLKADYFDPGMTLDELEKPPDDDRVDEQQWKKLIGHWLEEKAMETSTRNKKNRAQQKMIHCTGKRSFAVVRELEEERLGHAPSRADMFITCYTKPNGAPANKVAGEVIAQMKELIAEDPKENGRASEDDVYSKVMGADKPGSVRTYGLSVSCTEVWGAKASHASCHGLAMEYKKKFKHMEQQMEELKSLIMQHRRSDGGLYGNPSSPSNATSTPSLEHTPSLEDRPPASEVEPAPPTPNSELRPIQVGSFVILKSIVNLGEEVAKAVVHSMDPSSRVGGKILGPNWCEVHVLTPLKCDEYLIRPYSLMVTVEDAVGSPIAWPLSLVILDEDGDH